MSAARHCVLCAAALLSCYAAVAAARELYDYEYYAHAPLPTTAGPKGAPSPTPPVDYYYSGDDYAGPVAKQAQPQVQTNARSPDAQDNVAGTLPGAAPAPVQHPAADYESSTDDASQDVDTELEAFLDDDRDSQCRYAGYKQSKTAESVRAPLNMPCIDGPRTSNVTAQLNSHVQLTCVVHASRSILVTWWRNSQTYPTAIGSTVFVRNERFAVKHDGLNNWTMEIKFVQPEDAGLYKCQIDLPPLVNKRMLLTVVDELPEAQAQAQASSNLEISDTSTSTEPKANDQEARGTQNQVVEVGNPVELLCIASGKKGVAPQNADWFFRSHKLTNLQNRIAVINTVKDNKLVSTLRISAARATDEGSYICRSSEKQTYMFELRVISAEQASNPVLDAIKKKSPRATTSAAPPHFSMLPHILLSLSLARFVRCCRSS